MQTNGASPRSKCFHPPRREPLSRPGHRTLATRSYPVVNQLTTITSLPSWAKVIRPGHVLYHVYGSPGCCSLVHARLTATGRVPDRRHRDRCPTSRNQRRPVRAPGYVIRLNLSPSSMRSPVDQYGVSKLQAALGITRPETLTWGQVVFLPHRRPGYAVRQRRTSAGPCQP